MNLAGMNAGMNPGIATEGLGEHLSRGKRVGLIRLKLNHRRIPLTGIFAETGYDNRL